MRKTQRSTDLYSQPASGILVYGKNKEAERYFHRIVEDNHSVVMKVGLHFTINDPFRGSEDVIDRFT